MRANARAPRVVACMPAWNSTAFIGPVLASLAAQTYPHLDLLISVDACSDGTAELCDAFAAAHPCVTVLRQPLRLGWLGNANALLRAVDGDYAFFAFHDDPLEPDYVTRLVHALERSPNAVLAFCDVSSAIGTFRYDVLDGITEPFERARRVLMQRGPWWVPNRGLIRVSAVKTLGGMRRHLAGEFGADLPWLMRLALLGEFVRVPEALIVKAFRAEGVSARWRDDLWRRLAVELACLDVVRTAKLSGRCKLRLTFDAATFVARSELWRLKTRLRASGRRARTDARRDARDS